MIEPPSWPILVKTGCRRKTVSLRQVKRNGAIPMNPAKGYYSLIQYCPDLGRLEAANVGVLLFCPERQFLKARTSGNNSRIIHFFGSEGHDWVRLNAFKRGLEDRLVIEGNEIETVEQLERF